MTLDQARCGKCGCILQLDSQSAGPVACARCGHCMPRDQAFPRPRAASPRPLPRVVVAGDPRVGAVAPGRPAAGQAPARPVAGFGQTEEEEPSAVGAAFSDAFPWALSVAFHLGVLLLLTFFTTFVMPSGRNHKTAADADLDTPVFTEPGPAPHPSDIGDPDALAGVPHPTDFKGEPEGWGPGKPTHDIFAGGSGGLLDDPNDRGSKPLDKLNNFGIIVPGPGPNGISGKGKDGNGYGSWGDGWRDGGGRGGAGFYSVTMKGARTIAYLVDRSGSMTANFDYVKAELKRSIGALHPRQQFAILMFNDGAPEEFKISGRAGMAYASPDNKKLANAFIDGVVAESRTGQTCPQDAIRRTFTMNPEVVYLLTDGAFDGPDVPALVSGLNKDKKVRINTFLFCDHDKEGERTLKKIAAESNGQYTFLDEKNLGKDYDRAGE